MKRVEKRGKEEWMDKLEGREDRWGGRNETRIKGGGRSGERESGSGRKLKEEGKKTNSR